MKLKEKDQCVSKRVVRGDHRKSCCRAEGGTDPREQWPGVCVEGRDTEIKLV